ncbi:efflux transporter outer membrane subunit [Stakelama saccharophila]|uniref:Efflux transporter outer membrane subunit n=1 Tax=Stakelama saccharophila TaxID=3075605 RepID=A0ABZ0BBD7_9SPHN|nr:efflux transporter outer membrane subunit [Stakelama sp. W311]WNO54588.1 efflux transporter outer membrane subunit [Stakelama sp. W311]
MRKIVSIVSLAALSACSMAPTYVRPEPPIPASWPSGSPYLRQSEAGLPKVTYRQVFRDPGLQRLIEQALVNNRDLRQAAANIASARAQYRIQRADRLPGVDASAGATFRGGDGASAAGGNQGTGSGAGNGGATAGADEYYTAQAGVNAFEIDLFGRVKSLSDAALNQYFATAAGARATRLTLVGDIATAWLNHAADMSLLKIARQTVESAQKSVDLTRARLEGGVAPRTDLRQAQTILAQAQADLASSRTAVAQDVNLLRLLVGGPVDEAALPDSIDVAVQRLNEVPPGLDSSILLRRPDVVQAEYQLRAQNAQIGAARAAFFPRITLTGLVGFASTALGNLFDDDGFSWSVAPSATVPIFDGGANAANLAQAKADRDAALANYEGTIQTAFREVADALARRGTITEQVQATRDLVTASQDNYDLSYARYRGGIESFLQSLDARRSLYSAQRNLVATVLEKGTNLVNLYRVLGGDSMLDATDAGPQPVVGDPGPATLPAASSND